MKRMLRPRIYKAPWGTYIYITTDDLKTVSTEQVAGSSRIVEQARYIEAVDEKTGRGRVLKMVAGPSGQILSKNTEGHLKERGVYPDGMTAKKYEEAQGFRRGLGLFKKR